MTAFKQPVKKSTIGRHATFAAAPAMQAVGDFRAFAIAPEVMHGCSL
jgi:hypothetical protein